MHVHLVAKEVAIPGVVPHVIQDVKALVKQDVLAVLEVVLVVVLGTVWEIVG